MGVANIKDFYQLKELTDEDINFIKEFVIKPIQSQKIKDLNLGWIRIFEPVFSFKRFIELFSEEYEEN